MTFQQHLKKWQSLYQKACDHPLLIELHRFTSDLIPKMLEIIHSWFNYHLFSNFCFGFSNWHCCMFVRLCLVSFTSYLKSCASCVPCTHNSLAGSCSLSPLPPTAPHSLPIHTSPPCSYSHLPPHSVYCKTAFILFLSHYSCCRRWKIVEDSFKTEMII